MYISYVVSYILKHARILCNNKIKNRLTALHYFGNLINLIYNNTKKQIIYQ